MTGWGQKPTSPLRLGGPLFPCADISVAKPWRRSTRGRAGGHRAGGNDFRPPDLFRCCRHRTVVPLRRTLASRGIHTALPRYALWTPIAIAADRRQLRLPRCSNAAGCQTLSRPASNAIARLVNDPKPKSRTIQLGGGGPFASVWHPTGLGTAMASIAGPSSTISQERAQELMKWPPSNCEACPIPLITASVGACVSDLARVVNFAQIPPLNAATVQSTR
jgi:hypothetical protein